MTEDRPDPLDEVDDTTPAQDPPPPSDKPDVPNLLPKGFRGEQTSKGEHARLGAVELAKADRNSDHKNLQREHRKKRQASRGRRKQVEERTVRTEKVASSLIAGVILGAPLMIGAVHLVTIIPLVVLSLLAAACALLVCHQRQDPFRSDLLGWILLGLSALSFIQALPLPFGLVETLSPGVAAWVSQSFGMSPTSTSLALHPGEAARAGFGLLAATAMYFAAFNLFQNKARFQRMLLILPVTGVVLVVIGVLQKVLGSSGLLFFYIPRDLSDLPFFSATFVNPNHLATLLGLCSFVPLSLSLSNDYKLHRGLLLMLFGICSAGMVMTLSATAVLSWSIGLLAFAVLTLRRRFSSRRSVTWLSLSVLGAVALGIYAAWTQLSDRVAFLAEHQGLLWFRPTYLWAEGLYLARQHPWFGVGPGGFADAFATGEHPALPGRYNYVSNTYLQLAIDYGLPLAVIVIVAVGAAVLTLGLRRGWKREDLPVMTGLFAAFIFLGFEAAIGFSLEIPGVLLPVVFLLALARGRDARYQDLDARGLLIRSRKGKGDDSEEKPDPEDDAEDRIRRRRSSKPEISLWRRGAPMAAMFGVGLLSLLTLPAAMDAATGGPNHELRRLATQPKPDAEALTKAIQSALTRRPVYSPTHIAAALGHRATGHNDKATEALLRAQAFDRGNPAPWLLEAQIHIAEGKADKALDAYAHALSLACRLEGEGRDTIALEIAQVYKDPARVAQAMPEHPEVWDKLLSRLLNDRRPDRVIDIAEALTLRYKDHPGLPIIKIHTANAESALGRWARAEALANDLLDPESKAGPAAAFDILARASRHNKAYQKALDLAEEGLRQHPRDIELHFTAAELLLDFRDVFGSRELDDDWRRKIDGHLRALRPFAIQRPQLRHRFYRLSALYAASKRLVPTAIRDVRRALEADPDDADLTYLLTDLLQQERRTEEAIEASKRALERFPDHPQAVELRPQLKLLEAQKKTRDSYR